MIEAIVNYFSILLGIDIYETISELIMQINIINTNDISNTIDDINMKDNQHDQHDQEDEDVLLNIDITDIIMKYSDNNDINDNSHDNKIIEENTIYEDYELNTNSSTKMTLFNDQIDEKKIGVINEYKFMYDKKDDLLNINNKEYNYILDFISDLDNSKPEKLLNKKRSHQYKIDDYYKIKNKENIIYREEKTLWGDIFIYPDNLPLYEDKISIVTYNILNQIYMKKCNREDLSLLNRMIKILKEIQNLNSDIICLQEADLDIYKDYILKNTYFSTNYQFVYGVNCGSSFINIIGFKKNKYRLKSFKNFSLYTYKGMSGNRGIMNIIIENIYNHKLISIYNVHFPWRYEKERCHMLENIFNHILHINIDNIFLVGDFNSEPNSLPIQLIYLNHNQTNNLDSTHNIDYNTFKKIKDNYNFKSAYENYLNYHSQSNHLKSNNNMNNCHPIFTTCTQYYKQNIDYIFYSNNFQLIKILKLPNLEQVQEDDYLPSNKFPSDHLRLYAEYIFI